MAELELMTTDVSHDRIFLRPAYALHYRQGADAVWQHEARADYALLLLQRGEAATESQALSGSGALCFNPQHNTQITLHGADALWLTLAPALVLECAVRAGFTSPGGYVVWRAETIRQDERLAHLARELTDEVTQRAIGQEAFIAALLEQLLLHLLRHYANVKRAPEVELSRVGLVDRRIRRAIELMHTRLAEDLALEEIAAAAYLSPFHFARLFKKLTGTTPHQYLAGLRLIQARKLLADSDLSITEVALRVGHSSPSHFTKAFRQATGLTPREFRAALL